VLSGNARCSSTAELAACYGASVEEETTDFEDVFPRFAPFRRERPSTWDPC
jgi:hypothetical protein